MSCVLLQALMACGITAGTGDTSWPHLRNQDNPWQAQVLSIANNETVDGAATSAAVSVCCPCRSCSSLCLHLPHMLQPHLAA